MIGVVFAQEELTIAFHDLYSTCN